MTPSRMTVVMLAVGSLVFGRPASSHAQVKVYDEDARGYVVVDSALMDAKFRATADSLRPFVLALSSALTDIRRDSGRAGADRAYIAAEKNWDGLLSRPDRTLMDPQIEEWCFSGSNSLDDSISRFLAPRSLKFTCARGEYALFVSHTPLARMFGPYLTAGLRQYLVLIGGEEDREAFSDGAVSLPWDSIGERAADWESFIDRYPRFANVDAAKRSYAYYRTAFLVGTGNTPVFDYSSGSRVPDLPARQDAQDAYESFVTRHGSTNLGRLIRQYLDVLKASGFKRTKAVQEFIRKSGVKDPHDGVVLIP